ncbi:MAG: NADH-quinone oxidoreductase subunit J [Acidimicrobiia bacterium]|nr:NADH-quinone oxidoreductase subunit J [Acidimicrobiia bacterium]
MVDVIVFAVSALIILGGALGVILSRHSVHAALSLIATFFGVAVLFVQQQAHFLAVVQVVVYAGAIVVLFLFVIMLLGVDRTEDLAEEPLAGQRATALLLGGMLLALILGGLFLSGPGLDTEGGALALTGQSSQTASVRQLDESQSDIDLLADDLFTRNVLSFEATALLLTIATVGAVVLVRNRGGEDLVVDEPGSAKR